MIFKWKDAYNTNISTIDEQHKKLFAIGNKLYNIILVNDAFDHFDEIKRVIDELKDYTIYHFNYEEEMMEKLGYDKIDEHKIQHAAFVNRIRKFGDDDIDSQQKETIMTIINFIADWISSHIVKSDLQYRDYFISKGL